MDENKKAKSHSFIAGVIDFYFYSYVIQFLLNIVRCITGKNLSTEANLLMSFGLLLLTIILVVLYFVLISNKVRYLSLGEYLCGRRVISGDKVWTNPYNLNRLMIFFIIIFNMIAIGNYLDRGNTGYIYSFVELFANATRACIIIYSLIEISRKKLKGLLYLVGLTLGSIVVTYFRKLDPNVNGVYFTYAIIQSSIYLATFFIYKSALRKNNSL